MQQVGELLPVGSIVLLKGGTKKTMIMGVLQTDEEHPETVYDYMGIPYPEGYMGEESVYLFQHENINDIVFIKSNQRTEYRHMAHGIRCSQSLHGLACHLAYALSGHQR